jgi:plastocyanin
MKLIIKYNWILFVFAIALTACAGQTSPSDRPVESVKYAIEMSEFAFSPNTIEVEVGQEVTFELINRGALEHELMIGRDVKITADQPDGYQHEMFTSLNLEPVVMGGSTATDEMGHGHGSEHTGFMLTLPVGNEKATLTFHVTEEMLGEWDLGCFSQQGVHYGAGMHGKLIVTR